jgi:hypothetical protein
MLGPWLTSKDRDQNWADCWIPFLFPLRLPQSDWQMMKFGSLQDVTFEVWVSISSALVEQRGKFETTPDPKKG